MQLSEIQSIKDDSQAPVLITSAYSFYNYLIINDYVAVMVDRVSNSFDLSNPIPITHNSIVQGYLIFPKEKEDIVIATMTEFEFLSFLTTAQISDYSNSTYKFETNFLIIKADFFINYLEDHMDNSMLWGGFAHKLTTGAPATRYKSSITSIEIGDKLKVLDNYSYESCIRAIEQPYAFERYLKLYHLLELQFDYSVINKIQNLTIPSDSNRIGKILNEYSINELQRLTDLIETFCTDIASLELKLAKVSSFPAIAEDIFVHFGKSNREIHLIDLTKFRRVVSSGSFAKTNILSLKVHSTTHEKFVLNITAYWIYRIRCSIAHNKIGEYLLSWNDENFIVDFGEPLLKEVLIQFFKK